MKQVSESSDSTEVERDDSESEVEFENGLVEDEDDESVGDWDKSDLTDELVEPDDCIAADSCSAL